MSDLYEIRCDADGCRWTIRTFQAVTDEQARELVLVLGGSVSRGSSRDYHHCPAHSGKPRDCLGKLP